MDQKIQKIPRKHFVPYATATVFYHFSRGSQSKEQFERLLTHACVASAGNNSVKKEMLPVQISVTTCNMNMYEMHENAPEQ